MSTVIIGSARCDEHGRYSGGLKGDQTCKEVSTQNFYVHNKGWIILRAKEDKIANKLSRLMKDACNNKNIGYNQSDIYSIIKEGVYTERTCNCDCSSLVRECIIEATKKDPGDFNTVTEVKAIMNTGLFNQHIYTNGTKLYDGDILVTKTKGHTVIVVSGASRIKNRLDEPTTNKNKYYKKYTGVSSSIVEALNNINVDSSYNSRKAIAIKNEIVNYSGTADQNSKLLKLVKAGKLIRA